MTSSPPITSRIWGSCDLKRGLPSAVSWRAESGFPLSRNFAFSAAIAWRTTTIFMTSFVASEDALASDLHDARLGAEFLAFAASAASAAHERIGAVGRELPALGIVVQLQEDDIEHPLPQVAVADRHRDLDTVVDIPAHPIGGADKKLPVGGALRSASEIEDPRVVE